MCSFSALTALLRHLSSHPTSPLFSTEILHSSLPPSQFQCYLLFHCSSLVICFLLFPVLQSTLLCSSCLPAVHLVIWQCSSSGLWLFPPLIVLFFLFFYLLLYIFDGFLLTGSFFWSSNLHPFSVCPCPLPHHWVLVSPSSACGIFAMEWHFAMTFPSAIVLFCFGFVYLLIIYCTFFSFSFSHLVM